jgi:uncharacterized protein (DUF1810 family)
VCLVRDLDEDLWPGREFATGVTSHIGHVAARYFIRCLPCRSECSLLFKRLKPGQLQLLFRGAKTDRAGFFADLDGFTYIGRGSGSRLGCVGIGPRSRRLSSVVLILKATGSHSLYEAATFTSSNLQIDYMWVARMTALPSPNVNFHSVEGVSPVSDSFDLQRFVDAQASIYPQVVEELSRGRKRTHWMWFIFPQIAGLGFSAMAQRFAIGSHAEAVAYVEHDLLGPRLVEGTRLVLAASEKTITDILGSPDDVKFRSCMTLFDAVSKLEIFAEAIAAFYPDGRDRATLEILETSRRLS